MAELESASLLGNTRLESPDFDEVEARPTKRKREEEPDLQVKKPKRRRPKKTPAYDDGTLDGTLGVNHAIAHMDSRLMADHLAQRSKKFQPDLTIVELEESHISESAISDTTSWDKPRTDEHLPDFLEQFAGARRKRNGRTLADAPREKGNPHTLIVAGAGLRAANLVRGLRRFQTKEAHVAKLFAKHIKFPEAVATVKKSRMNIGVGTPQRIYDLLEDGALSSKNLERIIVDASHIDLKKRGVLDMQDTHIPLMKLLTRKELKDRYGDGGEKIQLMFF